MSIMPLIQHKPNNYKIILQIVNINKFNNYKWIKYDEQILAEQHMPNNQQINIKSFTILNIEVSKQGDCWKEKAQLTFLHIYSLNNISVPECDLSTLPNNIIINNVQTLSIKR